MPISVSGLTEVRRTMRALNDVTGAADLKRSFLDAADLVAVRARAKVPSKSGKAAGSIRSGATANGAYVKGGGTVPYYGWLDFGSRSPRTGNPRTRGPWSGSGKGPDKGRYIYPAIDENHEKIVDLIAKGIQSVIRRA